MSDASLLVSLCLQVACPDCGEPVGKKCVGTIYLERGKNVHEGRARAAAFLDRIFFDELGLGWAYERMFDKTHMALPKTVADMIVAWMATARRDRASKLSVPYD
jgi:hypothetical protein